VEVLWKEIFVGLGLLVSGSLEERLAISLELYDEHGTGLVSPADLKIVLSSLAKTLDFFGDRKASCRVCFCHLRHRRSGHDGIVVAISRMTNRVNHIYARAVLATTLTTQRQLDYDDIEELVESVFASNVESLSQGSLPYKEHISDLALHPVIETFLNEANS
jgi:hypothetical protein